MPYFTVGERSYDTETLESRFSRVIQIGNVLGGVDSPIVGDDDWQCIWDNPTSEQAPLSTLVSVGLHRLEGVFPTAEDDELVRSRGTTLDLVKNITSSTPEAVTVRLTNSTTGEQRKSIISHYAAREILRRVGFVDEGMNGVGLLRQIAIAISVHDDTRAGMYPGQQEEIDTLIGHLPEGIEPHIIQKAVELATQYPSRDYSRTLDKLLGQ